MKSLVPWIVVALLMLPLLAWLARRLREAGVGAGVADWPFYVKRPLTSMEQVLYHRLVKALPENIVLAQVQVSRVLGVKRGANFHHWNNRINRLSYDFVVCEKDASVLAVIELDDRSHQEVGRQTADQKKDKATNDAGLRIIRLNVKSLPGDDAIRRAVRQPRIG